MFVVDRDAAQRSRDLSVAGRQPDAFDRRVIMRWADRAPRSHSAPVPECCRSSTDRTFPGGFTVVNVSPVIH